jgi:uncharacterized protein YpuA (DUF1002 family)
MGAQKHRRGVSEVNLVVRKLKLERATSETMAKVVDEIDQLYGLDSVFYEEKPQILHLAYDASRLNIDGFEKLLHRYSVEVSHDWWTRLKEGYYRFVDQNVADNKTHESWGCHKKK